MLPSLGCLGSKRILLGGHLHCNKYFCIFLRTGPSRRKKSRSDFSLTWIVFLLRESQSGLGALGIVDRARIGAILRIGNPIAAFVVASQDVGGSLAPPKPLKVARPATDPAGPPHQSDGSIGRDFSYRRPIGPASRHIIHKFVRSAIAGSRVGLV